MTEINHGLTETILAEIELGEESPVLGTVFSDPWSLYNPDSDRIINPMPAVSDLGIKVVMLISEHRPWNPFDIYKMIRWGNESGVPVFIRPDKTEPFRRYLDAGATGYVLENATSREQVENAVAQAKFPPIGNRGYQPSKFVLGEEVHHNYGSELDFANLNFGFIVQVEGGKQSIDPKHLGELLTVPGVDGINLGSNDQAIRLSYQDGKLIPGSPADISKAEAFSHDEMDQSYKAVGQAAYNHNKFAVAHFGTTAQTKKYAQRLVERYGYHLIFVGTDLIKADPANRANILVDKELRPTIELVRNLTPDYEGLSQKTSLPYK